MQLEEQPQNIQSKASNTYESLINIKTLTKSINMLQMYWQRLCQLHLTLVQL